MTAPAWPELSGPPLRPREVTAVLRRIYPRSVPVRSSTGPDGSVVVSLGNLAGRYLGIGRDHEVAANRLGSYLGQPVKIRSFDYRDSARCCVFTVAPDPGGPWPTDPGGSLAVPAYTTTDQVLGDFPANRIVTGLISLALEAGCRPHLFPWRSGHGRQYRVGLWHTEPELLFGCIDAGEDSGRFAAAYLAWGSGPERRHDDPKTARQALAHCRDLYRAKTAAPARPPSSRRRTAGPGTRRAARPARKAR